MAKNERFPDDVIFSKDVSTVKLPPAPHQQIKPADLNTVVNTVLETGKFLPYNTTTHMLISKRDYAFWKEIMNLWKH